MYTIHREVYVVYGGYAKNRVGTYSYEQCFLLIK